MMASKGSNDRSIWAVCECECVCRSVSAHRDIETTLTSDICSKEGGVGFRREWERHRV